MIAPTPRTDAQLLVPFTDGSMRPPDASIMEGDPMFVSADFARQLETELAAAIAGERELFEALEVARGTIMIWHGESEVWKLYQSSPEMKRINNALARHESRKGGK